MKYLLTLFILSTVYQLFADFDKATIYKNNGEIISCQIDVYQSGVLIGNVDSLSYKIDQQVFYIALSHVVKVEMNNEKYHILTLKESSEHFFDEGVILEHKVLAKLLEEGEVSLYQYHYSGNSVFTNGANNKTFGKSLHTRPLISKNGETAVIYKLNYSSTLRTFFPECAKAILAAGFRYDRINAAIVEGNKYLTAQ